MQGQPDHTPWYQPRTAEIIQRGGENTAAAIGSGLQQFAQGIASGVMRRQEQKRLAEEKEAETAKTFRTYVAMGEQLGLPATALKNAGAEGAKGMVEGYIAKQKFDEFAAQIQERRAKAAAEARDAGALGQFNQRVRNVTTPMQIPAGTFGYGVQGGRLAPSGAETVGGQPLNRSTAVELALRSGVNPNALRDIAGSFPEDDGLSRYKSETERMRAEAYRKQVENSAAGADVPDEQPEQQPPAGYTWVRTERGWAMKKSGMSGFPADSKPVNLNGVEYMQGPDGTLYPTKQPGSGAAIANALGEKGGGAASSGSEVTRFTADGKAAVFDAKTKKFLRYAD